MILTLTQIDRGIFEALRLETVRLGYLPDIRTFDTAASYQTAIKGWKVATGKLPIEIWGVANYKDRASGTANNIVINRTGRPVGLIGAGTIDFVKQEPDLAGVTKYTKIRLPERSYNVTYTVTYNTESAFYDRVISQIIGGALGSRKYLMGVDNTNTVLENGFWLFYGTEADTSGSDFMERTLTYAVREVFLENEVILETDIPELKTYDPSVNPVVDEESPVEP